MKTVLIILINARANDNIIDVDGGYLFNVYLHRIEVRTRMNRKIKYKLHLGCVFQVENIHNLNTRYLIVSAKATFSLILKHVKVIMYVR